MGISSCSRNSACSGMLGGGGGFTFIMMVRSDANFRRLDRKLASERTFIMKVAGGVAMYPWANSYLVMTTYSRPKARLLMF